MFAISLLTYFGYHLLQGERGYIRLQELQTAVTDAQSTHDEIRARRNVIEHRVTLLRPETLDRDMLEERARSVLGYVHPDDVVILN